MDANWGWPWKPSDFRVKLSNFLGLITVQSAMSQLSSFSTPVGEPSMGTYWVVGRTWSRYAE